MEQKVKQAHIQTILCIPRELRPKILSLPHDTNFTGHTGTSLISKLNKTTCVLDQFPTKLLMSLLFYIIDIILCIVNLCFSSSVFPTACKSSIIFP